MPYVKDDIRVQVDDAIYQLVDKLGEIPAEEIEGAMNYTLTKVMLGAYEQAHGRLRYKHLNSMMGILTCMTQELYRRVGTWYEELAMLKNGDVPELERWGSWK